MEQTPRPWRVLRRNFPTGGKPAQTLVRKLGAAVLAGSVLLVAPRVPGLANAIPDILVTKPVHALGMLYNALSECRASLPEERRWKIAETIEREARRHGYDPLFVQAMIEVESTCKPNARSHKGAMGLIQVKPTTARAVAKDAGLPWEGAHALYDPDFNVRVGLHYLNQLEQRFGDPHAAIGAYNLGPTRARRMGTARAKNTRYVKKILSKYEELLSRQPASVGDAT